MTPYLRNAIIFRSSQQLPRLSLGPLEGLFELTLHGPSTHLVHCFRNYRDTRTRVRHAALGAEVSGLCKKNWRKPWLCFCIKHTCFIVPNIGRGPGHSWTPQPVRPPPSTYTNNHFLHQHMVDLCSDSVHFAFLWIFDTATFTSYSLLTALLDWLGPAHFRPPFPTTILTKTVSWLWYWF